MAKVLIPVDAVVVKLEPALEEFAEQEGEMWVHKKAQFGEGPLSRVEYKKKVTSHSGFKITKKKFLHLTLGDKPMVIEMTDYIFPAGVTWLFLCQCVPETLRLVEKQTMRGGYKIHQGDYEAWIAAASALNSYVNSTKNRRKKEIKLKSEKKRKKKQE